MPLWKSKCHSEKANAILMVEYYWIVIWEWHLLFPEKGDATPGCLCLGFSTLICHLRMAFAFSGKSKCHSWRSLPGFLDSYLSSENGIFFFWKKQMLLLEALAWISWLLSFIWEWNFLFPKKANATPQRALRGLLESYLSSENGICFFWKKQMPLLEALAWISCHLSFIWEWHLLFPNKANATPRRALL